MWAPEAHCGDEASVTHPQVALRLTSSLSCGSACWISPQITCLHKSPYPKVSCGGTQMGSEDRDVVCLLCSSPLHTAQCRHASSQLSASTSAVSPPARPGSGAGRQWWERHSSLPSRSLQSREENKGGCLPRSLPLGHGKKLRNVKKWGNSTD